MKKAILITLAALLAISSFTACGSKKNVDDGEPGYSRVLYDDNEETSSDEEDEEEEEPSEDEEQSEENSQEGDNSENSKEERKNSESDSEKKKGKTVVVSTTTSSSSSKSASSAKTTSGSASKTTVSSKSSKVTSSKTSVSSKTTSSKLNIDSNTDSASNTEWFDSENDSSDTDSEQEIEKGNFEYSDMTFPIYGGQIEVGQEFSVADNLLGGFNTENEISGGKVYSYNECTITTSVSADETQEYITNITISSPNYTISKGIGVGSTTEDLLRAYGDAEYGYTYTLGSKILNFIVIGDTVSEISFS